MKRDYTEKTQDIPTRVLQDNGADCNGRRMMGGKTPLVRRKDKGDRNPDRAVPGVYEPLQIDVINHGPRMAWAKLSESMNSLLRHVGNEPVFHRAQRPGPTDCPNPNPVPVEIALFGAVLDQAIAVVNAHKESRAMGLRKGECRNDAFLRLSEGRIKRPPQPLQLHRMRFSCHLCKVTESRQIKRDNRLWGDGTTQRVMLEYEHRRSFDPHLDRGRIATGGDCDGRGPYIPSDAANVFGLLRSGFVGGHFEDDNGFQCVLALCGRALRDAAQTEGEAVSLLDRRLRGRWASGRAGKLPARDRAGMEVLLTREATKRPSPRAGPPCQQE